MRWIRNAIIGFIIVLVIIFFFYLDNRTFNQLTDDQAYPMVDEPKNHPVSLTESSVAIPDSGVHMTKLYTLQNNENLFMGIWYRNRNKWLNQNEDKWKRNDGDMQLLVKAVDANGTTFNGKTKEAVHGTFSTFQYIHFNSFNYSKESQKLEFYFYPILSKGKEEEPAAQPVFQVSVPVSTLE